MIKASFILCFLMIANVAHAEPGISQVSGPFSHDGSIQIMGNNFGSKDPAAPVLWDNCSVNQPLSVFYDAYKPKASQQGDYYNIKYRQAGFRNVDPPNKYIRNFIAGAHAINRGTDGDEAGGNVGIGKNITSHKYFINFYYRLDPAFDDEANLLYEDNLKELVLSDTAGQFYPDGVEKFGYAAWCGSTVPDSNHRSGIRLARIPISPQNQELPYACSNDQYIVYHNNPVNGWIKMQWEGNYDFEHNSPQISLTTYPDGQRTYQSHYGDGITVLEYARGYWPGFPKENDLKFIGLGGFGRIPRENNGINSFRYFAAIYMDNTHARVMLGDQSEYNRCTIMEPQIPSAWSNTSVSVTVNLGGLQDSSTAYLYVFDANNQHNQNGFPVALVHDPSNAPYPPENLRVVEDDANQSE